mgnify:CR=1 FL=1
MLAVVKDCYHSAGPGFWTCGLGNPVFAGERQSLSRSGSAIRSYGGFRSCNRWAVRRSAHSDDAFWSGFLRTGLQLSCRFALLGSVGLDSHSVHLASVRAAEELPTGLLQRQRAGGVQLAVRMSPLVCVRSTQTPQQLMISSFIFKF